MLWHREFWNIAVAELLLSASVYCYLPALPMDFYHAGQPWSTIVSCFLGYMVGLFLLGGLVYHLIQRYRRNHVCELGLLFTAALQAAFYFLPQLHQPVYFLLVSLVSGAFIGLSQMVLLSTLVIDKTESFQRTEANYIVSWFNRLALAIGPLAGIVVYQFFGINIVFLTSAGLALAALLFIASVHFPFKTPDDDQKLFSCDRFFLKSGFPLFANFFCLTFATGLMLCHVFSLHFYVMLLGGFLLAILAEKYVFVNAELKSEAVTGCLLLMLSALIRLNRNESVAILASALLLGLGIGILGSRYLLFFIKLSRHCERGTSQSSFFLSWEAGLACGLACGYSFSCMSVDYCLALSIAFISLLSYNFLVHPWYLRHKNR